MLTEMFTVFTKMLITNARIGREQKGNQNEIMANYSVVWLPMDSIANRNRYRIHKGKGLEIMTGLDCYEKELGKSKQVDENYQEYALRMIAFALICIAQRMDR